MKSESRRPSLSSTVLCSSSANSFSEPGSRNLPGPRKLKMLLLLLWRERKGEPGMLSSDYRGQERERNRGGERPTNQQPDAPLPHTRDFRRTSKVCYRSSCTLNHIPLPIYLESPVYSFYGPCTQISFCFFVLITGSHRKCF